MQVGPEGRLRIDRYELVGEIASGGMATVYLGRLAGMGGFQRFVALKRLHPHLANETEFVEMFLDEARLAALIHHPNVVPILEVGASDGGYYLVMEYIEGDTLARLISRSAAAHKRLPVAIGIRALLDMLAGLHAAHELRDDNGVPTNLVHRDVSPQNVLVGVDGVARITDFGVAHAASRLAGTRAGQLKGKLAYMAPEQASGSEDLDRRADIFAAGVILWEVLTLRRLFKASTEAATLARVVSEPVVPPTRYNKELDARVSAVCLKALQRDPAQRYQTCAEFGVELEQASASAGCLASSRELATYVEGLLGEEIAEQRQAVRRWLAETESQDTSGPISSVVGPGSRPSQSDARRAALMPAGSVPTTSGMVSSNATAADPTYPGPRRSGRRFDRKVTWGLGLAIVLMVGAGWALLSRRAASPLPTAAPASAPGVDLAAAPARADESTEPSVSTGVMDLDQLPDTSTGSANKAETPEPSRGRTPRSGAGSDNETPATEPNNQPSYPAPRPRVSPRKPKPSLPDIDLSNPYR